MYNVYVRKICKRIFVITEIVRMNEKTGTGVNYMKEKVKESQSQCDTLARHPLRVPGRGRHKLDLLGESSALSKCTLNIILVLYYFSRILFNRFLHAWTGC